MPAYQDVFRQFSAALNHIRRTSWDMPSQRVRLFLAVVENPGITAPDIKRLMEREGEGFSQSSISRNINSLRGLEGAGRKPVETALIEAVADPINLKIVRLYVTPRGRQVAREVLRDLIGGNAADDFHIPTAREAKR